MVIRDRLYELNFDPGSYADGLKAAIREFEAQQQVGANRGGHAGAADAIARDRRVQAVGRHCLRQHRRQLANKVKAYTLSRASEPRFCLAGTREKRKDGCSGLTNKEFPPSRGLPPSPSTNVGYV